MTENRERAQHTVGSLTETGTTVAKSGMAGVKSTSSPNKSRGFPNDSIAAWVQSGLAVSDVR